MSGGNDRASDVVAHTPDPDRYHPTHYPGGPGEKLGSVSGVGMGVVIPRARGDGASRGVDHNRPGVVTVDPGPGSVVVDLESIDNESVLEALNHVNGHVGYGRDTDAETFAVMARLGRPASEVSAEDTMPEYLQDEPRAMAAPLRGPRRATQPRPKQAQQPEPAYEAVPPPPETAAEPAFTPAMFQTFLTIARQMGFQIGPPQLQPQPRDEPEREKEEEDVAVQTTRPARRQGAKGRPELVDANFDTLQIPFIIGPEAMKPTERVVFNMGDAGTLQKRYHAVVRTDACLVLVYDTRYVDGEQWAPPVRPYDQIDVTLTGEDGKPETISVMSGGLQFNLGCLDFVILVVYEPPAEQPAAQEAQDARDAQPGLDLLNLDGGSLTS